jgi:hypothetical protein
MQRQARPDLAGGAEASSFHHESLTARIVGLQSSENFAVFCESRFAAEMTCWPWVIESGMRLGMSRDEIRACVFSVRGAYERRAMEFPQPATEYERKRRLDVFRGLRELAIQRGVFAEEDWPDVAEVSERKLNGVHGF